MANSNLPKSSENSINNFSLSLAESEFPPPSYPLDLKKIRKYAELFEAYLFKEELLSIFDVDIDTTSAEVSLHNCCRMALNSAFKPFHRLAKSINDRMHLLLHWFRTHVTNAKTEALNNIIKSLLKRAYGYKDFEYFRLKVLQRCGYLMKRLTH